MSNTNKNPIISILNALLVLAGIASLIAGTNQSTQANLLTTSGQGAVAEQSAPVGEQFLTQGISLHPAAVAIPNMAPMLALGMLLILLGCTLHALLVLKNPKTEHTGIKKKVDGKDLNTIRQYLEIFWVDLRK